MILLTWAAVLPFIGGGLRFFPRDGGFESRTSQTTKAPVKLPALLLSDPGRHAAAFVLDGAEIAVGGRFTWTGAPPTHVEFNLWPRSSPPKVRNSVPALGQVFEAELDIKRESHPDGRRGSGVFKGVVTALRFRGADRCCLEVVPLLSNGNFYGNPEGNGFRSVSCPLSIADKNSPRNEHGEVAGRTSAAVLRTDKANPGARCRLLGSRIEMTRDHRIQFTCELASASRRDLPSHLLLIVWEGQPTRSGRIATEAWGTLRKVEEPNQQVVAHWDGSLKRNTRPGNAYTIEVIPLDENLEQFKDTNGKGLSWSEPFEEKRRPETDGD